VEKDADFSKLKAFVDALLCCKCKLNEPKKPHHMIFLWYSIEE